MSLRIDAYSRVSHVQVRSDAAAGAAPAKPADSHEARGAASEGPDRVTVSEEAKRLAEQAQAVSQERVERLRASIESGTYKVDAAHIASRIVHGD